jgi:hypothetical protein
MKGNTPKNLLNEPGFRNFIIFVSIFLLGVGSFVYFFVLPEVKKDRIRRESAQQAKVDGPKVLAELLGEVRLLRLAVEKLSH